MMHVKELDAHRSPIPGREVWIVSAWVDGRSWPEVVSFAHADLVSVSLEGRVVTVELEADGESRRHEWQFDGMSDAFDNYGRLANLIARDWPPRPLGSYGSIRTRPQPAVDVEIDPQPVVLTGIHAAHTSINVTDIPRIEIDTYTGHHPTQKKTITIPVRPGFTVRRVSDIVYYGDPDGPLASLTFITIHAADIHFRALRTHIADIETAADWHGRDLTVTYHPSTPEPPTPVEVVPADDEPWVARVARWQEQLGHVAHDQLCTIKASDLKVLIDEARTLHTQQLEAADLEPPTHARRLSNGKLRLLFGAPTVNLGDVIEVDVDEVERERWRRMPVLPDHIQVARGEYNDLLRLRNLLADFASSVGDSTIGRMIAAHVNNPTRIIKIEEIR